MLDLYIAIVKEDKVQLKDGLYTINDMFNGTVFLILKGGTLAGVLSSGNEEIARDYLTRVADKIP
jgi:hypothetical protein